ncbi:hypothetical protein B0H12DRAFT_1078535 [Mycena haematopus]|nr:hypothetical protein B0H12DRAFT_1078535 [Mycena haematopus]
MLSTFLPQTTFLALALVSLTSAGPITSRDDQLATFCWSDESCFQASAVPAGCVDLPLFSQNFTTASLSAPGLECILSPERECLGNTGFTGILFDSAGTVELSTLGIPTVASFICTSDVDLLNLCFPDTTTEGCFQATTVTDGCANAPRFSEAFARISLTTSGTQCTVFEDFDCAGDSAVIDEALTNVELNSLGLSNVASWSCVNA